MSRGDAGNSNGGPRASSAEALFAVNEQQRIVAWNSEAARIFGYPASAAVGSSCFKVVGGEDETGARFCRLGCPVIRAASGGETPPPPLRLQARTSTGARTGVDVSTIALTAGRAGAMVIHLCRPVEQPAQSAGGGLTSRLTAREQEVLASLCRGSTTEATASELGVSTTTVRNHVQRLLSKLAAHSRAEAVALAFREGFAAFVANGDNKGGTADFASK